VSFITNGLLLDRHLEEIMDRRISFAVSVDGVSEDTYGYFRGRNNLSRLLRNMRLFREMKEKNRENCPRLTLLVTVSRINVHELGEMVKLARAFGAETVVVQFQLFFRRERFEEESLFSGREEYNRYIALARREAAKSGITLIHPDSFDGETAVDRGEIENHWLGRNGKGGIRCFALSSVCYVKHDGVVEACCSPDHNIMGNLWTDSFDDIWYGPDYRALRLAFDRGQWPERCDCCNLIQSVDVHDKRAHLVEIHEQCPSSVAGPLKYDITGVERIYKKALSKVREDPEEALRLLSSVSGLDDNLYEVTNLIACIRGAHGETETMVRYLKRCAEIAPRDPYVLENYAYARELQL
jgi:pyruvate-formate lyase-activating enzyme